MSIDTNQPHSLLFEQSPFGTLDAIIQHDGKSVYFYLNEPESGRERPFGTRACWVRNLELGPMVLNEVDMKQGLTPMLPRTQCVHRDPQPIPDPENLAVIWFEEGNGAALIEMNGEPDEQPRTLAVIPPWSGLEGFHGYSAECASESPLCWPLPDNPKLQQRIERASQFWESWKQADDPFKKLQPKILAAYDERFKNATTDRQYFSIDGGTFPPCGLVQYSMDKPSDDQQPELVLATVGMSICPQPAVEIFTDDPQSLRRIELAIRVPTKHFGDDGLSIETLRQQLSGLARYPWAKFTWLGPGHTCGLSGAAPNSQSALLVHDTQLAQFQGSQSKQVELPRFREDPLNLLWIFPVSPEQQQRLQNNELSVEQFLAEA